MHHYDVIVVGATSAGVCAAVEAARGAAHVVLIEAGCHVGGMTSGGLGYTDIGNPRALGGPATRFRHDIAQYYGTSVGYWAGPEPHVAEEIMLRWLEESGIDLATGASVVGLGISLGLQGRRIDYIELVQGSCTPAGIWDPGALGNGGQAERWSAPVIIDATYEGDILAAAGVSYRVGRESRRLYGESLAGRREYAPGRHNLPPFLSPFWRDCGDGSQGDLLPGICPRPLVDVGEEDGAVMAYGYRVCLTRAPDRVEIAPSRTYNPADFELARRLFSFWQRHGVTHGAGWLVGLEPNLPGDKCDGNSLGPFSLNILDGSTWDYPDGNALRRQQIRDQHLSYTRDLLYFLRTDPDVPQEVRQEISRWGLPRDEFADTAHLPHQLYVREARRMVSDLVLTQEDLQAGRRFDDVVALGSYHLDVREVQRTWSWAWEHPDRRAFAWTEGYYSVPVPIYAIPYRALIPRREECENLLVPVCLSASHVAFSSVRMEPQYMMLGAAVGAAARQCLDGTSVQDVEIDRLQEQLRDCGQRLA